MSNAILGQIEAAEQAAEEIRAKAAREAREMIKSVEEAVVIESRQMGKSLHEESQRRIEAARLRVGDEIKSLEVRRSAEREAMRKLAQARVKSAGQAVFERVVDNGHR